MILTEIWCFICYLILGAAGRALGGRADFNLPVFGLPDPGRLAAAVVGRVVDPGVGGSAPPNI